VNEMFYLLLADLQLGKEELQAVPLSIYKFLKTAYGKPYATYGRK
jgi:hypothetical protein